MTRFRAFYHFDINIIKLEVFIHLLIQQTPPNRHDPLGRPPNKEQTDPGEQIPDSPFAEVQLSKLETGLTKLGFREIGSRLVSPAKGLSVDPDGNLLLKRPALRIDAPKLLMPKRPSA